MRSYGRPDVEFSGTDEVINLNSSEDGANRPYFPWGEDLLGGTGFGVEIFLMGTGTNKAPGTGKGEAVELPPVGQPVWVQCKGYRTLAYRDGEGKWRNVADKEEVVGVIRWIKDD